MTLRPVHRPQPARSTVSKAEYLLHEIVECCDMVVIVVGVSVPTNTLELFRRSVSLFAVTEQYF